MVRSAARVHGVGVDLQLRTMVQQAVEDVRRFVIRRQAKVGRIGRNGRKQRVLVVAALSGTQVGEPALREELLWMS